MEFLNPNMLWGMLGISIPIVLHFLHQKKAKTLDWAAFSFLEENHKMPKKGIQFDNLILLLLRCLLISLLSFLLAKPVFKPNNEGQEIYFIQNEPQLISNYKFEIEKAIKNNKPIYYLDDIEKPVSDLDTKPVKTNVNFQSIFNEIGKKYPDKKATFFLVNSPKNFTSPNYYIPVDFNIKSIVDSSKQNLKYIQLDKKTGLFVNNKLQTGELPKNIKPIISAPIKVKIETSDLEQKQNIEAALRVITEVYTLPFKLMDDPTQANIVFSEFKPKNFDGLHVLLQGSIADDQKYKFEEILTSEKSIDVFRGNLPEKTLEMILDYYELKNPQKPESENSFLSKFKIKTNKNKAQNNNLDKILLLLLITLLAFERWLSMKKHS